MKINQEESIKLYLRIKKPKIFENPYYDIDLKKNRFSLHNDNIKKSNEIFDINLDKSSQKTIQILLSLRKLALE